MIWNRASIQMSRANVEIEPGTSSVRAMERREHLMRRAVSACRVIAVVFTAAAATACTPLSQIVPGAGTVEAGKADATAETLARARAARANGELETAVRLYRAAMPAGAAEPALRVELGETLTDAGDFDQAYEAIDQALRDPRGEAQEAGYVALGRLFFKLRRPTESAAYFEKALAENPRNLRAMIGRGVALDLTGRFEQAQEVYLQALEVSPGDLRAQNNLALSYAVAGNFARAVEILHPMATAPTATPRLRQNLALIYGLMGNGELAASISRRDLDEATIQGNLRFYELLRRLPNPAEAVAGMGT